MLDWITGASRAAQPPGEADVGHNGAIEPPETPAPLFAVRAFKHAIFGTPMPAAPADARSTGVVGRVVEPSENVERKDGRTASSNDNVSRIPSADNLESSRAQATKQLQLPSPSKPSGILMTPRTATTRKKSVSFGAHVVDNENKKPGFISKTGLPNDYPGKFPSPWTPKVDGAVECRGRSKLTKSLYEARHPLDKEGEQVNAGRDKESVIPVDIQNTVANVPSTSATTQPRRRQLKAKDDTDVTVDLSEPKSQAGRYWKQEYESHAERTKREMERIVKKQRLAKKYAMRKDSEVVELASLLKQERHKIARLEATIADLTERIVTGNLEGPDQEQLVKDLAKETTKALEHQGKANHISFKLERQKRAIMSSQAMASKESGAVSSTTVKSDAVASEENGGHTNTNQYEVQIQLLQAENAALQKNLTRIKGELDQWTKRREQHDERQKQREKKLEDQKKDYQERLRQALAEQLRSSIENAMLKQQVATLQDAVSKQPVSGQGGDADVQQDQQQRKILKELREANKEAAVLRIDKENLATRPGDAHSKPEHPQTVVQQASNASSVIDIWTQEADPTPKARPQKTKTAEAGSVSAKSPLTSRAVNTTYSTPAPKSHQRPRGTPKEGSQRASVKSRKPLTPSSSVLPLPSPQQHSPSPPAANHLRNGQHTFFSPGPSLLHLPSSPPMSPLPPTPREADTATTEIETQNDLPIPPSSPLQAGYGSLAFPLNTVPVGAGSNRMTRSGTTSNPKTHVRAGSLVSAVGGRDCTRKVLPPDRAAAAKARLEQRRKMKAQEIGKGTDAAVALAV